MKDLTVREAFEKAGHPVPEGATEISLMKRDHSGAILWGCVKDGYLLFFYLDIWQAASPVDWVVKDGLNLSNLPAKDCLDALPKVVRKVVEASE